jgi:hypothetical protein
METDEASVGESGKHHTRAGYPNSTMDSSEGAYMSKDLSLGRKILYAYAAGHVRRWHAFQHTFPFKQENVAEHSHGVATIISLLHPDPSAKLLMAALHHDIPELKIGDTPRYTKVRNPEIDILLSRVEDKIIQDWKLYSEHDLDEEETQWLKSADLFSAWLFLLHCILSGNQMVQGDMNKATHTVRDWYKQGILPEPVINAMEQIRAVYSWVKIW